MSAKRPGLLATSHGSAQQFDFEEMDPGIFVKPMKFAAPARLVRHLSLWFICFLSLQAHAQWVTQQIKLVPGFNPVYLQVTPAGNDCSSVFGSTPGITGVWMYNRYVQLSTFAVSPSQSIPGQDHWLMWFPTTSSKSFLSTLAQVRGGQSYLISLASNAAPVTLQIKGIPISPRIDWIPFDLVLAGFPVSETAKVTFYQFMKDNPEVSTTPGSASGIYSITPSSARETQIRNPEITAITPGRAYWVRLGAQSDNPFPFQVITPGENNSVQFSQHPTPVTLTLVNSVKTAPQKIHLQLLNSETPPSGMPLRAGPAPVAALVPLPDGSLSPKLLTNGLDITLAAGETRQLQVGLATALLNPYSGSDATYQSLIEVTESTHGYRQLIPVVAEVAGSSLAAKGFSLLGTVKTSHTKLDATPTVTSDAPSAGLWVGTVKLNAVNQPGFSRTNTPDTSTYPLLPATPLDLRVLIHVDSNGVPRLVQQVFFAQVTEGSNQVVRMYNTMSGIPPGGIPKSRVSAPSWPGLPPTPMSGAWGNTITASLFIPFNDRLNPFVHRYHPDHNNLAEDYETPLPAGQESFDINRTATFYFGDTIQSSSTTFQPAQPAMNFTGASGEYVKTTAFTNNTALTVQFWAYFPTNVQNAATVLLLTNTTTRTMFRIGFDPSGGGLLALSVRNQAGVTGTVTTSDSVPAGRWFNITATYDGVNGDFYFDGQSAATGILPSLEPGAGAWTSLWIGNSATNGSGSFKGEVHDVVVRNGATSSDVVAQLTLVPQLIDPANIVVELQGNAVDSTILNKGNGAVSISYTGPGIIDLSTSPSVPLWTYGTAQGTYRETITGLRRQAITVGGTFELTRVTQDSSLR